MSLGTLEEFCNSISFILSSSTIEEAFYDKPGNASRWRDIKSVSFKDLVLSALVSKEYYKELCKRGLRKEKPLFDSLYKAVLKSMELGINFAILGTFIHMIPIAYSSISRSLDDTLKKASVTIRSLDENDSIYFSKSLQILGLSYLGEIDSGFDYRTIGKLPLYEVLLHSSSDSAVKNMLEDYKFSRLVVDKIEKLGMEKGVLEGFLSVLCKVPDGLIWRKHGGRTAITVSKMSCEALENPKLINELDKFLLENGYNPGSTADIVAVGIALFKLGEWYDKNGVNYFNSMQRGCDRVP
jgi:triphosphoribosyl-dephospho-CoA synthase